MDQFNDALNLERYCLKSSCGMLNRAGNVPKRSSRKGLRLQFLWNGSGYLLRTEDGQYLSKSEASETLQFTSSAASAILWTVTAGALPRTISLQTSAGAFLSLGDQVSLNPQQDRSTALRLCRTDRWIRFGEAYLSLLGWAPHQFGVRGAFRSYEINRSIGIKQTDDPDAASLSELQADSEEAAKHSTVTVYSGCSLLRAQFGGTFPKLRFAGHPMSKVGCEIIALYNALRLAGAVVSDTETAFFRLALECELNAKWLGGSFGTNPMQLGNCLASYGVSFRRYRFYECIQLDQALPYGTAAIVSYWFRGMHVHTCCCFPRYGRVFTLNRGCGNLYEWKNNSIRQCLSGARFWTGYLLLSDRGQKNPSG